MIPFKENSLILAPMAGITDSGFRKICIKYGADAVFSEMVSAKGISYKDKKSYTLLEYESDERPISLQIFGNDPESMKNATEYINLNHSPASIDINMGCPAPKIFQNGDGCALMKDLDKAYKVITAVKQNTSFPVSVKFRSGVDSEHINAVEFAKMCENASTDFITVHARTREQYYSGKADISIIKKVVDSVTIPVIANGDICDKSTADEMLLRTGAHSVMIGRAALGNPSIFDEIKNINKTKSQKLDIAIEHLQNVIADKGEFTAVKEFRKHLMWYIKGIKNAAKLKQACCSVNTFSDCINIINITKSEVEE